jgi:hypothetical protein
MMWLHLPAMALIQNSQNKLQWPISALFLNDYHRFVILPFFFLLSLLLIPNVLVGFQVADGSFRSRQSGNWNVAATWERLTSGVWNLATIAPTSANESITIRSGHTVTITASVAIDQTTVEQNATLIIGAGNITLTVANGIGTDLSVAGTFRSISNRDITRTGTIEFLANARYEHVRHGGQVPIAAWNVSSTCAILGGTTAGGTLPTNLNQSFGDFEWNYTTQSRAIAMNGQPATIMGSFRVLNTNNQQLSLFSANGQTRSIAGDFVLSNGVVVGAASITGNTSTTLNIGHAALISGGSFQLTAGAADTVVVNVADTLRLIGGTLSLSGSTNVGRINAQKDVLFTGGTVTETCLPASRFSWEPRRSWDLEHLRFPPGRRSASVLPRVLLSPERLAIFSAPAFEVFPVPPTISTTDSLRREQERDCPRQSID